MPRINTENEERRSFFQWINFLIPYLYTSGIILILIWMILASLLLFQHTLKENPKELFLQSEKNESSEAKSNVKTIESPSSSSSQEKETWLTILVKPIVESNFNKIIFRGLFLLLIWMLLFLIIPVAFKRLKRFKFFNMEFEVDNIEQAAIETVEISGTKAKLMAYLTSDHATGRTLEFLNDSIIDYKEVLEYFLAEIQAGYKNPPLHATFSYNVYNGAIPEELHELVEETKETGESAIFNKNNQDSILKKNYLVFYFCYGVDEYVTVISSYTYPFDILDRYLFELLHNTISKNIENIEYMVALTSTGDDGNGT
ncbi:hypothetical protein [Peribacillus asahii]|uniref:Uncharacterized protein n=1 Tax=Peribacillus asahii TaxID=228899 RepID=A0A3Q9RN75_9BACI|nr:hypothetical protein [Peribacillus asahii]AZV42960.1 hypothetical protein BAOM_2351 [Peribacillus asahii]USK87156.1 hypothetical protein LIT35_11295 [Peribacillus asahii]